jgi:hypothetical protein
VVADQIRVAAKAHQQAGQWRDGWDGRCGFDGRIRCIDDANDLPLLVLVHDVHHLHLIGHESDIVQGRAENDGEPNPVLAALNDHLDLVARFMVPEDRSDLFGRSFPDVLIGDRQEAVIDSQAGLIRAATGRQADDAVAFAALAFAEDDAEARRKA